MRAVIQRVSTASVSIAGVAHAAIGRGLAVLLAVAEGDQDADVDWLAGKIVRMRIFPDAAGLMNRSLLDVDGALLVVSQFTLLGSTKEGNRPSFTRAAKPEAAQGLYLALVGRCAQLLGRAVATGTFGADMQIALVNDGPVTILIDSRQRE
jgi:D-tyrosyl-tRNA(Tyr) deacylase